MNYPHSIQQLEADLAGAPHTTITALAKNIIEGAKKFDLQKAENLGVNFKLKGAERNLDHPTFTEHDSILGAPWADGPNSPLQDGEEWNKGRRAVNTGISYAFNNAGKPIQTQD